MTATQDRLIDRMAGFGLLTALLLPLACRGGPDDYVPVRYAPAEAPLDRKLVPETLEEMRAIEEVVTQVAPGVTAATVGVVFRGLYANSQGSGVIVSEDGLVLTAAHVIPKAGARAQIVLPDGRRVRGVALGLDEGDDSGMIRIQDPGPYAFAELAPDDPPIGQWCIATGHPGGYEKGRSPVFRLGRVLGRWDGFLQTDCPIFSGDSGGPLFDLEGRVIGVHSRIRKNLDFNLHVPVTDFRREWKQLALEEPEAPDHPILGVTVGELRGQDGVEVVQLIAGHSAERAGFRVGDVITEYDGTAIRSIDDLSGMIRRASDGQRASVRVRRGDESLVLRPRLRTLEGAAR